MKPNLLSLQFIAYLAIVMLALPNDTANRYSTAASKKSKKTAVAPPPIKSKVQDIQDDVVFRY